MFNAPANPQIGMVAIRTPSPTLEEVEGEEDTTLHLCRDQDSSFPKAIYYIVGNEFCERFSFYGMKAILPIYLTAWLSFSEDRATTIIHSFNFAAYFFTLFGRELIVSLGALLADSGVGKYRTILSVSVLYALGSVILAVTSVPALSGVWGMAIGLILLAMGTGGIKPCVSSFGGDQFAEGQEHLISRFFSLFYFAINAGSVLSMFLTPILRQDLHW